VSSLETLDYANCFDAMRRCKLTFSPSEAHAIAVGLLAGNLTDPEAHWSAAMYADLDPNDALVRECRSCLDALFQATAEQMRDAEFGLQLFLPPQDVVDYDPASALRDWAQGFLYGFGLVGEASASALLSPEGQEALRDFYEIGNMEVPEQPGGEEEQQALAEIEEYLRVAAMLIHEDMHVPQATGEVSHEIH
jgi:uncharacterized protein YgfB (UPF0149 family)